MNHKWKKLQLSITLLLRPKKLQHSTKWRTANVCDRSAMVRVCMRQPTQLHVALRFYESHKQSLVYVSEFSLTKCSLDKDWIVWVYEVLRKTVVSHDYLEEVLERLGITIIWKRSCERLLVLIIWKRSCERLFVSHDYLWELNWKGNWN